MICNRSSSSPIPIPKFIKNNIYSLNNSIFDPNNSSPPNDFILKLNQRSIIYGDNIFTNKNEKENKKYFKNIKNNINNHSITSLEKK